MKKAPAATFRNKASGPDSRHFRITTSGQKTHPQKQTNMSPKIKSLLLGLLSLTVGPLLSVAADGYGRNATGGAGGTSVTVTTAAAFKAAVESTATSTITVSGTIDLGASGRVNMSTGNKTIKGANSGATVKGTIQLSGVNNVIIQNLNISANTGAAASNDGISVNGSTNVYITKCTVYDCTDGNIDVCKGSDYVTVSWCKFYYTRDNGHNFSNLIGSSDTDTGGYHHTWHHNWWSTGCKQRMLADRFGPCHMYNNYWNCSGNDYCTTARNVTQMLSENNYYEGVKNPLAKEGSAKLKTSGNVFSNCTGTQVTSSDSVFTPNYGYTLDTAANAKTRVLAGAGNR
jgi:pectate lyase